jgi:DNA processing protein
MRRMNSGGLSSRRNDPDERLAYIALALIPGLGARRLAGLLSSLGSARDVLRASHAELMNAGGISHETASAILTPPFRNAAALLKFSESRGQRTLVPCDADYPNMLRSIPDPPVLLFARGRIEALAPPGVAIVGSRVHSRYGGEIARLMGETAANAGIPVISGMARGLDAVAQGAALDAGGRSIGVLGTGADVVYPLENKPLFERMLSEGLLLTEHPPGDRANRWAFPRRNRLISGLAQALVVVEAAEGSGTLVTVTCALEQGRDVFVVPGPINSPTSTGTNRLLRDGATPLLGPDDLRAAFGVTSGAAAPARPTPPRCDLSFEEAQVLAGLSEMPRTVDDVALAVGLPIGLLLATLLGLELGGLVEQLPDNRYRRR